MSNEFAADTSEFAAEGSLGENFDDSSEVDLGGDADIGGDADSGKQDEGYSGGSGDAADADVAQNDGNSDEGQQEQPAQEAYSEDRQRTNELTKRYLTLLAAGKLASKKKQESLILLTARKAASEERQRSARSKAGFVFDKDMLRLQLTAKAMGVQPIPRNTGGTHSSGGDRFRSTKAFQRLSRSASEPTRCGVESQNRKVYTPGPGAYNATTNRFGNTAGTSTTFSKERQRPPNACVSDTVISPGPIYIPSVDSQSQRPGFPTISFPRRDVGSRFDPSACMPHNCPHWNPSPADYTPSTLHTGKQVDTGPNAPRYGFSKSVKMISPEANLSATVFISNAHSMKENACVHSPGPAEYTPRNTATKNNSVVITMAPKAPSYFDSFLDPGRQTSPGPIYEMQTCDRNGTKTFGHDAMPVFGKATKMWSPETNLSAVPFVSYEHALRTNQALHSPGPKYYPPVEFKSSSIRAGTTSIGSGQVDRFYSRFEPGRVV